jgi:hypothetical protein
MGAVRASTCDSGVRAMRSMRVARCRSGRVAARRGRHSASYMALSSLGGPGSRTTILRWRPTTVSMYWPGALPIGVGEDLGAVEDIGLLGVVGRQGNAASGGALVEIGEDVGVAVQAEVEGGGDGLAGEVVLGGAEATGEDDTSARPERDLARRW